MGLGAGFYDFMITNVGGSAYPGFQQNDSPWQASLSPANCTMACKAHGFKYTALIGDAQCHCGTISPAARGLPTSSLSSLKQTDSAEANTCHSNNWKACPADFYVWACGYMVGGANTFQADLYIDSTFASESALALIDETQQSRWGYLGCFTMGASLSAALQPVGYTNQFSTATSCYAFCASLYMPLAGMQYSSSASPCVDPTF